MAAEEWRFPRPFNGDDQMTIEQLRNAYDAQPFRPFVSHLADGRAIPVSVRKRRA
jgi:hypothetical protein